MSSITILGSGTSQGVPMIGCNCNVCLSTDKKDNRLRSSVFIEHNGVNIVIDTSMDFRYQMLRANILKIDAILYTHSHKDHVGGLDDVRAYNYITKKDVNLYATSKTAVVLKKDFDYSFAQNRYPGVPAITLTEIENKPFFVNGIEIIPVRGLHYKMEVFGYKIGNMCYITDMNHIEESELDKIRGIDVLIINALRHEEHISHFNLTGALEVIEKVKPNRAFLTHISHQLGLYVDIEPTLPSNVSMAYDTLKIEF